LCNVVVRYFASWYAGAVRNNNSNSGYSNHILNTGHAYGSVTNTMKVIKIEKK
jgi:hypothetical protein